VTAVPLGVAYGRVRPPITITAWLLAGAACAALLVGCGGGEVSSAFKGVEHAVAEAVGNLQSYATAGENEKVCAQLFTKANVKQLGGQVGCEAAVKSQLGEVDSFELSTKAVKVEGDKATANVESVVDGKKKSQQVQLVKEGGSWRIAALQ